MDMPLPTTANSSQLASLPDELIIRLLLLLSTPSFLQLIQTSHRFYDIAATSRDVLLHHLSAVPGNKLGLEDSSLQDTDLFLLLRQRMSKNLFGVNFTANCSEYVSRNARIDPTASCISGFDTDYIRMSLAFRDSSSIRQYTSHGSLKERVDDVLGLGAKILFMHHRKHYVSVLCSWQKPEKLETPPIPQYLKDEDIDLKSTVRRELQRVATYDRESKIEWPQERSQKPKRIRYRVLHFDAFSKDDPFCFVIDKHKELVPKHFTVCTRGYFAILWDREDSRHSTKEAEVVKYTASKFILHEPVPFEAKLIWPKQKRPRARNSEEEEETSPTQFPKRIAFFKDGRRMRMWTESEALPYQVLSTNSNDYDRYSPTNIIHYDEFSIKVDLPFYGTHETVTQENSPIGFCHLTHLALGVTTVSANQNEDLKVMYILRSKSRQHPRSCDHTVGLQRMVHVSAGTTKVVARLWGWHEFPSSFTGLETVCISKEGTRIAISMWDKVLVYTLDPKILCQETLEESEEDLYQTGQKKKRKNKKGEKTEVDDFYERGKDSIVGWNVAVLRPIILDLKGAVAHKMSWTTLKKRSASIPTIDEASHPEPQSNEAGEESKGNEDTNIQPPAPEASAQTTENSTETETSVEGPTQELSSGGLPDAVQTPQVLGSSGIAEPEQTCTNEDKEENVAPTGLDASMPDFVQVSDLNASQPTMLNAVASPPTSPVANPQKSSSRKKEKAPEVSTLTEVLPKKELTLLPKQVEKEAESKTAENNKESSVKEVTPPVNEGGPSGTSAATCSSTEKDETDKTSTMTSSTIKPNTQAGPSDLEQAKSPANVNVEAATETPAETEIVVPESPEEKKPDKFPRQKRRTEDQLVVLTDRGVQIWNLGPECVGIREQGELRLEESLKGKLPMRGE